MRTELVQWHNEQRCKKAVEALCKNGFEAEYCETGLKARDIILAEAGSASSIGFGGSVSVTGLQVTDPLQAMGKELLIHGLPGLSPDEKLDIMRRQLTCDLFLCGTNALTLEGQLVNVDATGNRVGAMCFGPRRIIVVAGRNKIVEDTAEAMNRIKYKAAPPNARRLGYKTPCAVTGFCNDCGSPERICRITVVMERRPRLSEIQVLVVNEDLGL